MDKLHRAYRRAESQLISTLESRKGEVKVCHMSCQGYTKLIVEVRVN